MKDKKEPNSYDLEALRAECNFGRGLIFVLDDPLEIRTTGKYSAQNYIKRLRETLPPEEFAKLEYRIKELGLTSASD